MRLKHHNLAINLYEKSTLAYTFQCFNPFLTADYLLPQHERGIYQPIEDRRTETLWREISGQLKAFFRPKHYQLLMRLMATTSASWPAREDVRFVLRHLHKIMQRKRLRAHHGKMDNPMTR